MSSVVKSAHVPPDNAVFCTVITPDYMAFALTLAESIEEWVPGAPVYALVSCTGDELRNVSLPADTNLRLLSADDLRGIRMGAEVYDKYYGVNVHAYRWSSKPSLMTYLLAETGADSVIFFDGDILVTGDCSSLLEEISVVSVLLTPHWHEKHPTGNHSYFFDWFRYGLYNAGFVGATKSGLTALEWWHRACMCECDCDPERGLFQDQKYLDLLPVVFYNVRVTNDLRYNVGGWRLDEFFAGNTDHEGNGAGPVFLHFTRLDMVDLPGPSEGVLVDYSERLIRNGLEYNFLDRLKERRAQSAAERAEHKRQHRRPLNRLRRTLALRTRLLCLLEAFKPHPSPPLRKASE